MILQSLGCFAVQHFDQFQALVAADEGLQTAAGEVTWHDFFGGVGKITSVLS